MKKCKKTEKTSFWKKLGPGLVTGVSDDDPSGITTYSQAGAAFGLSFLWVSLLTYPLMYVLQEMCARIGIVTGSGLTKIIKNQYSKWFAYVVVLLIVPAIVFNIAANISVMSEITHSLVPFIPKLIIDVFLVIFVILFLIYFSFKRATILLRYVCLSLLCYFIVPFLVDVDWIEVMNHTFFPHIPWNKDYFFLFVALLGTTISPYLFFWQSSMSCEQMHHDHVKAGIEIRDMHVDVNAGMLVSNLGMYFIILTTGSVLYPNGVTHIETVYQAASALEPLAGKFSYLLFSLGVLGVGLLSLPVLTGCIGYILAEALGWSKGLDKKLYQAPRFYLVIIATMTIALVVNLIGLDPIRALIYTAILYGITAPFVIFIILLISNNRSILGKRTNTVFENFVGGVALFLMSMADVALLVNFLME